MPTLLLACAAILSAPPADGPIRLLPANPHYLEFRGRPTVLVASGEHYGAVLNLDFDPIPYLDELRARGLNLTRTFAGTYFEAPGAFKIASNTLAPAPGRYAGPWAQAEAGKYDLGRFDPAYFERLKTFLKSADDRGIVVEYVLFCPFYEESMWAPNPMNARNNVNGVGDCPREEVYTLKHPDLLKYQLDFVRKAVAELNGFDNLYFEICNEPYFGGVTPDWQARVAEAIVEAEKALPKTHLIAQNIANGKAKVETPNPLVSVFNFHYASPPDTVGLNYGLDRPIADDETGFKGTGDAFYRKEAWEFLLAGGSIFSHLDYSFTTDCEDGTAEVKDPTPGGGGPTLRKQFAILKRFLERFDFARMRPDAKAVVGAAEGITPRVLAEPGRQYAIYLRGGGPPNLALDLPAGSYEVEWIDPTDGRSLARGELQSQGGRTALTSPEYADDAAIRIVAKPRP